MPSNRAAIRDSSNAWMGLPTLSRQTAQQKGRWMYNNGDIYRRLAALPRRRPDAATIKGTPRRDIN